LRALVKHIEKISDEEIPNIEILPGTLIQYEFEEGMKLKSKAVL
jgi:bisphosphoglycerate-dependent phosphoglycerate mutase